MTTIHPHAINPRYQLYDTVTNERHSVTFGDPILTSVTSHINQLAMDAMPKDARANAWLPEPQLQRSAAVGVPPRGRLPTSQQQSSNMLRGYGSTNMPTPNDPLMSRYAAPPNRPNRRGNDQAEPPDAQQLLDFIQILLNGLADPGEKN